MKETSRYACELLQGVANDVFLGCPCAFTCPGSEKSAEASNVNLQHGCRYCRLYRICAVTTFRCLTQLYGLIPSMGRTTLSESSRSTWQLSNSLDTLMSRLWGHQTAKRCAFCPVVAISMAPCEANFLTCPCITIAGT